MADSAILQRIQQQYDGRAVAYDQDTTYHPSLAQHLLSLIELEPGQRLLDLASGTGLVALSAAVAVAPTGLVVAVDITEAMLQQSRSKYALLQQSYESYPQQPAKAGLAAIHHVPGDMEDLDSCLPSEWRGSFDAITCSAAVPFLRNPQAALTQWRQWLKQPGGLLALSAFKVPFIRDYSTFITLAKQFGLSDEFDPCERLGSEDRLRDVLQQAGFTQIQVSSQQKERWYDAPTMEAYCNLMWNVGVSNPHKDPARLQKLGDKHQQFRDAFAAAVAQDVLKEGRYDYKGKRVSNPCTVLYAVAKAP